jgi:hypothetical protein
MTWFFEGAACSLHGVAEGSVCFFYKCVTEAPGDAASENDYSA